MTSKVDLLEMDDMTILFHYQTAGASEWDEVEVDRYAFEKWVDWHDKREWSLREEQGKYDWEQYYEDTRRFEQDLAEFWTVRNERGGLRNFPNLGKYDLKKML